MFTTAQICKSLHKSGFREWQTGDTPWLPIDPKSIPSPTWDDAVLMPQPPAELMLVDAGGGVHTYALR
jgi:hypothetical protein